MASDEMHDTMVSPSEAVSRQDRIGFCGEITIGEKQQLDPLSHLLLARKQWVGARFYVRHIDLSRNL
jgi:hypothetical protein